jgi:hypothetical protein
MYTLGITANKKYNVITLTQKHKGREEHIITIFEPIKTTTLLLLKDKPTN